MSKYYKNEDFFKTWSNDMAYILGWIVADGHVGERFWKIEIHKKDVNILNSIKNIIEYNGILYDKKYDGIVMQHSLNISSTKMANDLRFFGLDNNKSFTLKWIENIPSQYLSHFVRGFFDGDGSIHYIKAHNPQYRNIGINFVATSSFIQELKNNINNTLSLIAKGNISYTPYKKQEGFYAQLIYHGVENVKTILDWIYQDSTESTRLERKYDMYYNYFYNGEYEEYRKHADEFQSNKTYIPYELAEEIRSDYKDGLNQQEISDKHQVNRTILKNVVENKTHTRTDNRRSDTTRDFLLNGIVQHEKDIAKEANVDISTLRYRTRKMGMKIEDAVSLAVDRGKNNSRTHLLTVFGEEKSLREWSKDSRCKVSYPTLYHRLFNMGMDIQEAMTTTDKIASSKPNIRPSRALLTQEQANEIRKIKNELNSTNAQIADKYGISVYIINDIISGKTYNDGTYNRSVKTQLKFEYQGKQMTLQELSGLSGVSYSTIDRRIREGKTVEEAISKERMKGTKSLSNKDIAASTMAAKVRSAYMCGKRETEICDMFSIPQSRYTDIILNRTSKDETIWWK